MSTASTKKALAIVEEFRKFDPLMTSVRMSAFLYIADAQHGVSVRELYNYLDISQSAAVKTLQYLEGLELVEGETVPTPQPHRVYQPTSKGRAVVRSISAYLK